MKIRAKRGMTYDGVWMGHGGEVFVAFDPPWWHVWRWGQWLWYTRVKKRPRGTVIITNEMEKSTREVRLWKLPPAPKPRIEDQFRPR